MFTMSINNNYNFQLKKEKKIVGSPEPISIAGTRKILEQLINCVCKIKVKGAYGTGFFWRQVTQRYCRRNRGLRVKYRLALLR